MEKTKNNSGIIDNSAQDETKDFHVLSLMEVQEKLGLFKHQQDELRKKQQPAQKNMPLAFI